MLDAAIKKAPHAEWAGFCPICKRDTVFRADDTWYRDFLTCISCNGGSIPRERALMVMIDRLVPHWRELAIHESSPVPRSVSALLRAECPNYIATQFLGNEGLGLEHSGVRNENLEKQTFPDRQFDLVITQDVMEHVFDPASAYREIMRTLKPGGYHIHTTPMYVNLPKSERYADLKNGEIIYLRDPEYHGNPVGDGRSLVTFHYGHDLPELISSWTGYGAEVTWFSDPKRGLVAEFLSVIVCRKD